MSSKTLTPLFWRDNLVGHVDGLSIDNLFIYGRWVPADDCQSEPFVAAVEAGEDVVVHIGRRASSWQGLVEAVSDGLIEMKFRLGDAGR